MEADHTTFTNYVQVLPTPMTVKMLREILEHYDDDIVIVVKQDGGYGGEYIAADVVSVDEREYYNNDKYNYIKQKGETLEIL